MLRRNHRDATGNGAFISVMLFIFVLISSWLTHIVVCLQEELWGFLIAGAIVFPIAVIHGIGIWIGAW